MVREVLVLMAVGLGGLGVALLVAMAAAVRRHHVFGVVLSSCLALALLSLAAVCGTIAVATMGYRALTREEVAAVVEVRPVGPARFEARFRFSDGRQATYELAGDALYVDAHILKWKPIANLLGLHTAYELDRVAGRYEELEDERYRERTVFSLARGKPLDMFELRRRFPVFRPLLDAEYGSATFVPVDRPATFEVRVSTTGLLVRPAAPGSGGTP